MAARFWVGGTGTWDAVTTLHWAASSGGASGASVPVVGTDTVAIDANSGGGIITITNTSIPGFDCTGAPATTIVVDATNVDFNSSVVLVANITLSFGAFNFRAKPASGTTTMQWTFGGATLTGTGSFVMNGGSTGASCSLQDSGSFPGDLNFLEGTFNMGTSHTLSVSRITGGGVTLMTLNFGTTSTLNLTSTATTTIADFAHIATASTAGGSVIVVSTISANVRTFAGANRIFPQIQYIVNGSTGGLTMTGANTYAGDPGIDFRDTTNARTLILPAAATSTFNNTNGLNAQGTAGKLMTVKSSAGASAATIALAAGKRIDVAYTALQDLTGPGLSKMFATNSTDTSGNTLISFVSSSITDTDDPTVTDGDTPASATFSDTDDPTVAEGDTPASATVTDTEDPTVAEGDTAASATFSDSENPAITDGDTAAAATFSDTETATIAEGDMPASATTSASDDPTIGDLDAGVGVTISDSDNPVTADQWAALTAQLSSIDNPTITDAIGVIAFAASDSLVVMDSLGSVYVVPFVPPPITPTGVVVARIISTDDLLGLVNIGIRAESVRFELLDASLNHITDLHPLRESSISITNDTTQDVKRSMSGLFVDHSEQALIDEFVHRVRPSWLLENGAQFPLGVFLFGDASRSRTTQGLDLHGQLVDQCYILNQSDGVVVGYSEGVAIADALRAEFGAAGIVAFAVDDSLVRITAPIAWPAEATRLERMRALCVLGGYADPYFDNNGVGRCVIIPDIAAIQPALVYREDSIIRRDTLVESNNLLTAPNRYIVLSTSASSVPIVGIYDIPDSAPHSRARRGFVVSKTINTQGVVEPAQASLVAQQEAAKDATGFAFAEFTTAPNPRHDTYDPVEYLDDNYLEVGWTLTLAPGGDHTHKLRRAYA